MIGQEREREGGRGGEGARVNTATGVYAAADLLRRN